jgi:hypothetical protein
MFQGKQSTITKSNNHLNGHEYVQGDIAEVIAKTYSCLVEIRYYNNDGTYTVKLPNGCFVSSRVIGNKVDRNLDPHYVHGLTHASPHFTRDFVQENSLRKFGYIAWYDRLEKYGVSRPLTVKDLLSGSHATINSGNEMEIIMDIFDGEILDCFKQKIGYEKQFPIVVKITDDAIYGVGPAGRKRLEEYLNNNFFITLTKR